MITEHLNPELSSLDRPIVHPQHDLYIRPPRAGEQVDAGVYGDVTLDGSLPCGQVVCNPNNALCPGNKQYEAASSVPVGIGRTALLEAVRHSCDTAAALRILDVKANEHPLTCLPNRNGFLVQTSKFIDGMNWGHEVDGTRSTADIVIIAIDLRDFKKLNDALGHDGGDRALIEIGEELKAILRSTDIVGHPHGDEFYIAANIDGPEGIDEIMCKLNDLKITKLCPAGEEVGVTIRSAHVLLSDFVRSSGVQPGYLSLMTLSQKKDIVDAMISLADVKLTEIGNSEKKLKNQKIVNDAEEYIRDVVTRTLGPEEIENFMPSIMKPLIAALETNGSR